MTPRPPRSRPRRRSGPGGPRAGIPDAERHREKWRLALDMLDELAGWQLAPPVVVADAGYGNTAEFRAGLTERGRPSLCRSMAT
jgi:SRSO17 transposase